MQDPSHIAEALVAPWCAWWVDAPDEATLLDRLASIGPLPQADLFEPWDDEPWRARVLCPPLDRAAELLALGTLEPSDPPGTLEWSDRGRILEDTLSVDGLEARLLSDQEQGGVLLPQLQEHGPDVLQRAFRLATGSDEAHAIRVLHPTSGRHGVHFHLAVSDDDPIAERQAVLQAVAHVRQSAEPSLGHRVRWWFELKRIHVIAWRIVPALRTLPSVSFQLQRVDLRGWDGDRELQILLPQDQQEALLLNLSSHLGEEDWSGSRARWIGANFLPCWTHPTLDRAASIDIPHRIVPGCPRGLEGDWLGVDPEWWSAGGRCFTRLHCNLHDRDLLPHRSPRDGDAIDRALAERLSSLAHIQPVHAGFPAIELRLPALDDASWATLVEAIGLLPEPSIGPVIYVRMGSSFILLLQRIDIEGEVPVWSIL